jgi:hypothetical protein
MGFWAARPLALPIPEKVKNQISDRIKRDGAYLDLLSITF